MNVTIELSAEQAAALKVQAEAQGLTVERWLEQLAAQFAPSTSITHLRPPLLRSGHSGFTSGPKVMTARRRFWARTPPVARVSIRTASRRRRGEKGACSPQIYLRRAPVIAR